MCLLSATQPPASADPTFKYGDAKELAEIDGTEWRASAQAGFALTDGNTRTTAFSSGGKVSRRTDCNKFLLESVVAYTKAKVRAASDDNGDGVIEAGEIFRRRIISNQSWRVDGRYDRFFAESNSAYLTGNIGGDEPAGKELVGGGQIGYARNLWRDSITDVSAELGYDFSYEDYVATGPGVAIHSARLFFGYSGKLTGRTGLEGSTEVLFNLNDEQTPVGMIEPLGDTRFTGKLAFTTELVDIVDLRFAFTAKYDQAPAAAPAIEGFTYAPGFVPLAEELDTRTEAQLVVNFL